MKSVFKLMVLPLLLVLLAGSLWADEYESDDEALAQKPFLGVEVGSVSKQLRHHLDLDEDVGLSVNYVVPDSAADKAGLERYDILTHFNDQLILAQAQFSALLRRSSPGDAITMTVLRKGEAVVLNGNMGSRLDQHKKKENTFDWSPDVDFMFEMETQEAIATAMEAASEAMVIAEEALEELKDNPEIRAEIERGYAQAMQAIEEATQEMKESEEWKEHFETAKQALKMKIHAYTSDSAEAPHTMHAYSSATKDANIVFKDDAGTLILNVARGNKTLTAMDNEGTLLFTGPINTAEDMELIPGPVRARMEKVEGIQINEDGTFEAPKIEVIVPSPDSGMTMVAPSGQDMIVVPAPPVAPVPPVPPLPAVDPFPVTESETL